MRPGVSDRQAAPSSLLGVAVAHDLNAMKRTVLKNVSVSSTFDGERVLVRKRDHGEREISAKITRDKKRRRDEFEVTNIDRILVKVLRDQDDATDGGIRDPDAYQLKRKAADDDSNGWYGFTGDIVSETAVYWVLAFERPRLHRVQAL